VPTGFPISETAVFGTGLLGHWYPSARCGHSHGVDRSAGGEEHGPVVRSAPGAVGRYLRQPDDSQVIAGAIENPAPFRAGAVDSALAIYFHAVGHTVLGGEHVGEHPVVAQGAVGSHVEGPYHLVGALLSPLLLLDATVIPPGDSHVKDAFVGRKSQSVGEVQFAGHGGHGTIGTDAVNPAGVNLTVRRSDPVARVGEVDAAVGAGYQVVGAVQPLAIAGFGQGCHRAVRFLAGDSPSVTLAHNQPALQVEGQPIGPVRVLPECLEFAAGGDAEHQASADIHEQPMAVGMPNRSFREHEISGQALGLRRF